MSEYVLHWDDCPPSMNAHKASGYKSHWAHGAKIKRDWEGKLFVMLLQASVPKNLSRVEASMELTFTDRRRRDAGNYRMVIEKALGDVLVAQGYLPDDTPDHYAFPYVTFEKGASKAMKITLECQA